MARVLLAVLLLVDVSAQTGTRAVTSGGDEPGEDERHAVVSVANRLVSLFNRQRGRQVVPAAATSADIDEVNGTSRGAFRRAAGGMCRYA